MRRGFTVVAALSLAILAAALTLGLGLAVTLAGSRAASAAPLLEGLLAFAWAEHPDRLARAAIHAGLRSVGLLACAPVICTALIGEAAGFRSLAWYAGSAVALTALLPLAARPGWMAAAPMPALGMLMATGAVAGVTYWLVARPQSAAPEEASRFDLPVSAKSATQDTKT